jgi:amylosucrase
MLEVMLHLANLGVDVLRLDAIAFLWKRLGTGLPERARGARAHPGAAGGARIAAPAVVLKAEAIVAPHDLVPYLGTGRHHGKVSDLAYHNSLMVQVWSMLASRDGGSPPRAAAVRPDAPRRPRGSPTCAATTTSAGRSTTATPRRSA